MKKFVMFGICCLPLLGSTCPVASTNVPGIGVTCANNLDASSFGFKLTVPADFQCITVPLNSKLLVSTRYQQNSTKFVVAVNLAKPDPDEDCDSNGVPDAAEIATDPNKDANSNGIIDACEGCAGNPDCQEVAPIPIGNNVTFRIFRFLGTSSVFTQSANSYVGTATLGNGNILGISVSVVSATDNPTLKTILETIIQSVVLTQ